MHNAVDAIANRALKLSIFLPPEKQSDVFSLWRRARAKRGGRSRSVSQVSRNHEFAFMKIPGKKL
jgi:hypothetical protein